MHADKDIPLHSYAPSRLMPGMARRPSIGRELPHVTKGYISRLFGTFLILITWLSATVVIVSKYSVSQTTIPDTRQIASSSELNILSMERNNLRRVVRELHQMKVRMTRSLNDTVAKVAEPEIVDIRPLACRMRNFGTQPPHTSLILELHKRSKEDIEEVLQKIQVATSMVVVKEVMIIHGGLNLEYLRKDSRFQDIRALNFIDQFRIRRHHNQSSVLHAKIKAAKMAFGAILVFADGDVMWTKGWLQPLLVELEKEPKTIATPAFFPHDEHLKSGASIPKYASGVSWSLSTVLVEDVPPSWDLDGLTPLRSPALRGHVIAVKKKFFMSLGYFEDQLEDGGGENVELSFKTWLCGGNIKIVPCSRVGIHYYYDAQKIRNIKNIYVIAELWLDWYKKVLSAKSNSGYQPSQSQMYKIIEKRNYFNELKCKSFYWYSESVPMSIALPHASAVHYGHLVSRSGKCATLGPERQILLSQCLPGIDKPYTLFQLLSDGRLVTLGLFLHPDAHGNVVQQVYNEIAPPAMWTMTSAGQLTVRVKSSQHLCATERLGRVRMEPCLPKKSEQIWKFVIN